MPAPALAAIPILVSFAEAAGIVVAGVATAAGIDTLSKKVEEYVEENPEQSQKILAMIMPAQGIANILKNESDDGEEVSETEVTVESEPRSKKEIVLEEVARGRAGRGNFSSPDAEGPAVSITGNVKRGLRDAGKIRQGNDPNYDPDKPKFDWRSRQRKKADGGIMGGNKTYHQVRDQFMPMDSESMEYANGGGVGSMMKRKSFKGGGSDASKSDFGKSKSTNREKGIMSRGKGPKGTTGNINNTGNNNNNNNNNNDNAITFAPNIQKLKKEPAGLAVLQDIFPFLNKYKAPPKILNEPEEDTKFDYKLLNSFLSEDPLLQTYYDKGLLKNNNIKKFNENEFKKGYMSNEDFQKDISEDKRDLHGYTYTGGTQFPTPETAKNIYINNLESFKKPVGPLYGTKELSDYRGNVGKDYLDAKSYSLGPVTAPGGQRDFLTNRERINQDLNSDSKWIRESALSNIFGYYNSPEDVLEDTYQRENEGVLSGERDENGNPYKVGYDGTDSPTMTERNKQIAETIGHEARHQLIGTNLTDESKFTAPFGPASFEERFANSLPSLPGTNLGATDRSGKSNFPGVYGKHESLNRMLDFKAYNDPGIYETVYEGIGMPRNLTNRYTDALDKNANLFTQQFANGGGVGSMMQPKKKRVSFKGGGADMGATDKAQERADRGYGSTAPADDRSTQQQTDNNNRVTGNNNNKPTISFAPVVQYQDNPILNSALPTGVLGIDTNLGNSFKVRSMIDAVNTLKQDELIGDLEVNAILGDLGIRGYMDNEKNKNLDINYNDGTLSGQFNTDFENLNNLGIGFDKNGYTGNISTDFENTNARVGKTIDNPFGLKGNLTFGADTDFDKNKNIKLQYGMSFENGGRVNYNQGSNWWDTLDSQGMGVYNSMKRGGHDDATIQSQLSMLGYYDPNTTPPDSTPDIVQPNIVKQLGYSGGDNFSPIKSVTKDPRISAANEADIRNRQLTSMGINDPFADEISLSGAYYGDMPTDTSNLIGKQSMLGKAKQGLSGIVGNVKGLMDSPIGNAIGFAMNPVMGGLKGIASMLGNVMPINQRSIQENIMGNMGVAVNDIGQIVSTGDYDDPNNVMAGYNLNRMTPATFKNRIDKIRNRAMPQTIASANRIKSIKEAQRRFELGEKLKEERLLEKQLQRAQKEIDRKGYQDYGQGGADQATQNSYQGSDGNYAGSSTQDYDTPD